ncbi:MAG: hypothetical protein ACRENZ_03335 [Thermodesulfobacteriota bacterium]
MNKFFLPTVSGLFLAMILFFGPAFVTNAAAPQETIIGTVTLVGDNVMQLLEDGTGIKHEFEISQAQEENLTTGYKVALNTENGKVASYTVLGIPENVAEIVYMTQGLDQSSSQWIHF